MVAPFAIATMLLGSGITIAVLSIVGAFDPPPAQVVLERVSAPVDAALSADTVVERLRPSLVQIEVARAGTIDHATGVAYRSDGYVLTTADAVAGASSVTVITHSGSRLPAKVVGIDLPDDVAVLSIDSAAVESAVLARSAALDPGTSVLALSLDEDPTEPIVIAEQISADGDRVDLADGTVMHGMIAATPSEPTAKFALGSSDAVLVDSRGGVLGLFTTRAPRQSSGGYAVGERFATPIDFAVRIADDLVATGSVHQPWLGVRSNDLDSATVTRIGRSGTFLTQVAAGSPAETAGLKVSDIVITIDASPIGSSSDLVTTLRHHQVGDTIEISYIRDGAKRVTTVTLGNRP